MFKRSPSLRTFSTSLRRFNQAPVEKDFRPPWVYKYTRVATSMSICAIIPYAVFFHDFGEDEHVFQPIRRWVARHKASLFALTPAEEKFIESEKQSAKARDDSKSGT
ncbi:hypothetical protein BDP27DRAFT_1334964 [Rhodocollybia butyracea]|uniref:Uncharacterized protein n=1 Tax=Rhodocollybia butyracea TaxID=206335 RepID=A0A9P5PJ66_9AGAR|nr:hypothetical protein BDP27DRAFT_1334964 [Rhodocollybia butyracea]